MHYSGEAGKVTAVSVFRFISVAPGPSGKGLEVKLRGHPRESVPLLFASASSGESIADAFTGHESEYAPARYALKCSVVIATIGADGTGVAHFGL